MEDNLLYTKSLAMNDSAKVNMITIKVLSWIGILFFLFCTIGCVYAGQGYCAPYFMPFIALALIMLLLSGKAEINDNGIKVIIPIGTFYVGWDEVEYIETNSGNMVIGGHGKKLSFSTPVFWDGKDKVKAIELFLKALKDRGIVIKQSKSAFLPQYKNSKY